jgi:hypothetical protein
MQDSAAAYASTYCSASGYICQSDHIVDTASMGL